MFGIWSLKVGMEHREGGDTAPEPTIPLPPSKARWIAKENDNWHKDLLTDIAMLIRSHGNNLDLVEVFCSQTSQLTRIAQDANLKAERWTSNDFDLSKPSGCQQAMDRLRKERPNRSWLSPECGPPLPCEISIKSPLIKTKKSERRGSTLSECGKAAYDWHGYKWNWAVQSISNNHNGA